jgi:integrase
VIAKQEQTHVDERDMFTIEEVKALREACDNPRDCCLLELLLNTGQRIRAIQTLRVKDVDIENDVYWLNSDVNGLKGAEKNGGKRPLLGANQAVYDWLQYHPKRESEATLITKRPSSNRGTPGEPIAQSSMRKALRKIADRAEVDKPPNPHNFRHYFVTIAKREYDMDDATIKYLIGHSADSTVMETTYQHLTDEDYLKDAEVNFGVREPEKESPLTPEVCDTCGNQLDPNAKACERCGAVFTPDAQAAQKEAESRIVEVENETEGKIVKAVLEDVRSNPDEYL